MQVQRRWFSGAKEVVQVVILMMVQRYCRGSTEVLRCSLHSGVEQVQVQRRYRGVYVQRSRDGGEIVVQRWFSSAGAGAGAQELTRSTAAEVHSRRSSGAEVQRRCTAGEQRCKVQRCRGAEVQRCRGAEVQRCRGAEMQRCRDAEVQSW
jgi:hypothetical protein